MVKKQVKRSTPLSIAVSDEHLSALDEIISHDPLYPPPRSVIGGWAILHLRDSIRRGDTTLLDVFQAYGTSDIRR